MNNRSVYTRSGNNEWATPPLPNKKYNIIYADPPWAYPESGSNPKVHGKHYSMMATSEIWSLPISHIVDDNCALFLWVTMPRLVDGIVCMGEWGFSYKTVGFVWVKANKRCIDPKVFDPFMGAGSWTRSNAELCLLGFKGKMQRQSASVRNVIYTPIEKHSQKPDEARERIVQLMGDLPRIELFARSKAEGWDGWGLEYPPAVEVVRRDA